MKRLLLLVFLIFGPVSAAGAGLDDGIAAYMRGDHVAAYREWGPLAEAGNREAQYFLGHLYAEGEGVLPDQAEALHWFHAAAAQGDPYGQFALGFMYENGKGVAQDYSKAAHWYRMAAEQSNVIAQNNLGLMYENGRGVPRDFVMAYVWFALAASLSASEHDKPVRNLEQLSRKMTPDQIATGKRLATERLRDSPATH